MNTRMNTTALHGSFRFMGTPSRHGMRLPGIAFEKDDGTGGGDDAAAAAEAARLAAEEAAKSKPSDDAAKLLKEVMTLKNKIKEKDAAIARFDGIDPEAVKTMLAERQVQVDAAREAEEKRLKAAGDFDSLKASMAAEHARQLQAERDARTADRTERDKMLRRMEELTVGQDFANSSFLRDDTLLTPAKARKVYGDFFDIEDGVVKPYTKERGEAGREPLVTATGEPLAFDEAMRRIIDADPDRDHLLRSKGKPGTGNPPANGKVPPAGGQTKIEPGPARILVGLASLMKG